MHVQSACMKIVSNRPKLIFDYEILYFAFFFLIFLYSLLPIILLTKKLNTHRYTN